MKTLIDLFFTFCRIGGLTFGGGYAMLPMIQKEIVEEKKWATEEEVLDYYAVGQCTPGIIAVNTATFIGYKVQGIIGAIVGPTVFKVLKINNPISRGVSLGTASHAVKLKFERR